jgi:hypothetical protein
MKPLNLDNRPCSPISSNCVIWQGPDIPCIKLCTGDTVSDIVFKLATELCTIMDTLDIKNYDLSCFDLAVCPPDTFQELIQFLIEQICSLQGLTPGTDGTKSTCPDCVVSVAPCLRNTDPSLPATMQLVDYVQLLANKICTLIDQVSIINSQITNIDNRVTVLENTPPPTFTIPSIETGCLIDYIPGTPPSTTIDVILNVLLNNNTIGYCALIDATGFPAEILSAVQVQCIDGTSESLANPGDTMSNYPNWIETPITAADAITNLWVALCDVYNSLPAIPLTVEDTNSINLEYTSGTLSANIQDTGWVDLEGFGFYAGNSITAYKPKCRRIGNVVHFRGILMIPLSSNGTGGGAALPWDYGSIDTYVSNTTVAPFTGIGGVRVDNNGSITFNSNGSVGQPVIPLSVMDAGTTFDSIVQTNYVVASRYIKLQTNDSAMLTTVVKIWIKPDKTLLLQYLKDNEYSVGGIAGNITGTSVLNTLVSRVNVGDRLPQFARAGSTIAGNTTANQQPLTATYYPTPVLPALPELYPFTCNAGDPDNTGGFGWLSIDGMMAYIQPCTPDIKNYSCP